MKSLAMLLVAVLLLAAISSGCSGVREPASEPPQEVPSQNAAPLQSGQESMDTPMPPQSKPSEPETVPEAPLQKSSAWVYGGQAIAGTYADADIVELEEGKYRMYFSIEPEVPGNKLEMFSAISGDGKEWETESGVRKEFSTFPDIVKLPDGKYRIYFQSQGVMKSATSADGLSWTDEPGTRIDSSNNAGLNLENVAAPTTISLGDSYLMVYRGTINQKYPAKVPNDNTQILLWATSKDGLAFDKKGVALDSRDALFQGLLDGPELVKWDDGTIRLYFWSYKGVFHTTFTGEGFSGDAEFDYTTASNPMIQFPENPPGDPTLAKINGEWLMYYGQHTKGIYYATLNTP